MNHSKTAFQQDVHCFENFKSQIDLHDIPKLLMQVDQKMAKKDLSMLKDRLEGLMHAEGAGSIIQDNKSLPQIVQKILIHLEHIAELK